MIQTRYLLCFHFTVNRASLGRFLPPCSPGEFIEHALVSKVMDLPGPVVCLMQGHIFPLLSGRDTRWAGASLSLQTSCTSMCAQRPWRLLFQICLQHHNLGLCRSQTRLAKAERKSRPARLEATLCPWALKKLQQQGRDTVYQHLKWNSYFSTGLGC